MNILIVKMSALGDVVMSLPFLEAVRRTYPSAHLAWLVEESAADIVRDHPSLDEVIVFPRKRWIRDLKAGKLSAVRKEWGAFRRRLRGRWDMAVDLQGLLKSGTLTRFSCARRRIGFDRTRELSYIFLNERLPAYDPDRHALRRYLDAAEYLGAYAPEDEPLLLPPHEAARKEAAGLVEKGRVVVVNPGAKWKTKLWPAGYWRRLLEMLTADPSIRAVVTGSPDEADENRALAAGLPRATDLTGRTNLKVLAEIFRRAELVICPDTGPMHLAAAAGAPVVALFGPTSPGRTGPWGTGHVVLRSGADCSPCFRKRCPEPHCMTDITPEAVFDAAAGKIRLEPH